jgi:hypothetical protein
MSQLTFFAEEPLVKHSVLPGCALDWPIPAETSPSRTLPLLQSIGPSGWYGRTSPEFFQAYLTQLPMRVHRRSTWEAWTDPATGQRSWLKTSTTLSKHTPSPASWPDFQNSGMGGPTEFSTLSTLEWPSAAVVRSLSDILETGAVPQQYFLSGTACRGILRRAEKRGKELPQTLLQALQQVAEASNAAVSRADKTRLSPLSTTRKSGDQVTTGA